MFGKLRGALGRYDSMLERRAIRAQNSKYWPQAPE
jgi:hypothetical protein